MRKKRVQEGESEECMFMYAREERWEIEWGLQGFMYLFGAMTAPMGPLT